MTTSIILVLNFQRNYFSEYYDNSIQYKFQHIGLLYYYGIILITFGLKQWNWVYVHA